MATVPASDLIASEISRYYDLFRKAEDALAAGDESTERTADEMLRRLLDERAVERILKRYCRLLDDRCVEALLELFTDDAEVQFWGQALRGKDALAEAYGGGLGEATSRPTSVHVLSNVLVDVDGDTARATSDFAVVSRAEDGAYGIAVSGRFIDELVRSPAGDWRIRERLTRALARS